MKGIRVKTNSALIVAGLALSALPLIAAPVGDDFTLATASTQMSFRKDSSGAWLLTYYGPKLADAADAQALAWTPNYGRSDVGTATPLTYTAFGAPNLRGYARGFNKFAGLCVTHADGCVTTDLRGESAETVADAEGVTHLVLTLKDSHYPFTVRQHFRAMGSSDVIESWIEILNGENGAVRLARMASVSMVFPLMGREFRVQTAAANWAAEGQLTESGLARGQAVSISARSGVRDAWMNNPSLMLTIGPKATERTGRVIGAALCWSGMWDMSVRRDEIDMVELVAGPSTAAGAYVLDPGKSIELPKLALTFSDRGKGQVSRNMHRWARDWRLPAGHKARPVLLNSWEGSYFSFTEKVLHDMMDGVKEMGGELFVLDDGWFGKGKYARNDVNRDKVGLGDWIEDLEHIPHGLADLDREARARGLRFGFWVEPEMVNTNSWLFEAHPDWVLREKNRPVRVGRGGSQTVLDMSNPAVQDNIFGQLDALYSKMPELAYIKWDANADFYNYGSTYLDADHQANLAFDYTKGVYSVLARLRAKYPNLDVQACSSGGGHMEYGFLQYTDEFWTSDDSDARERVFIQWGASQFYPACTMAAHVTASPNHQTKRVSPLKFRFDVAMTGRLGFELHPKDLTADEIRFAKQCVADYKRLRPTIQQGDLYRLASPYENEFSALMYVNGARTSAVVTYLGLTHGIRRDYTPRLRFDGLDPAKRYRIREINVLGRKHSHLDGKTLGGDALMLEGFLCSLGGDYDSAVFELTAE